MTERWPKLRELAERLTGELSLDETEAELRRELEPLLGVVVHTLKSLVVSLTPEMLEQLSEEDTVHLTRGLQETHCLLASFCTSPNLRYLRRRPVTSGFLTTIEESTEDLGDIIDDLVLSRNDDFRVLLSACASWIAILGQMESDTALGHRTFAPINAAFTDADRWTGRMLSAFSKWAAIAKQERRG